MDAVPQGLLHLLWIVPLLLLILFISSPRFRGDIAQTHVRRLLANALDSRHYSILNDIKLPMGGGSTVVNHLVVSKFGVFVIHSQYARGWVSGGEFQDRWKYEYLGKIRQFDNPLHQVKVQADAIAALLEIPDSRIKSLVVLSGHKGFRKNQPNAVVSAERLVQRLRKFGEHILDEKQVAAILQKLKEAELPRREGVFVNPWLVLRWVLLSALLLGCWMAFKQDVSRVMQRADAPPQSPPSWEDTLICAYSQDTSRCACYDPDGVRVDIDAARCRELSERGSILKK